MTKRQSYDWKAIIDEARKKGGRWFTRPEMANAPARLESSIRLRRHPDLRVKDGRLQAELTNEYVDEQGTKRGIIWLRFLLNEEIEERRHGQ